MKNQTSAEDVVIARIIKARGIRGEVACAVETDFPERFSELENARIRMPDGSTLELPVEDFWFHQDRIVLKFKGYDTMTAAEGLVGGQIVIAEDELRPVEDGEFFEHQLIGSEVVSTTGDVLGTVKRLMRTGGTDLLVVEHGQNERFIPFADDICVDVDVSAKRITVSAPEGLLEL